jgi:hypothetical protein
VGNFTASIDWGDGTTTPGVITGSGGAYAVSGTHTYAGEGTFAVKVTVSDIANAQNASATGTATVGESDVLAGTGRTFVATQGVLFNGVVATFSDTNAANTAGDFTATINWGDSTSSAGVVTGGNGSFTVTGTHTYTSTGAFSVIITLTDVPPGSATANTTSSALVAAAAPAGPIPTLGDFGLLAVSLLLAAAGVFASRRR